MTGPTVLKMKNLSGVHPKELLDDPKLAIFVVATYGEGSPPDNSAAFFSELCDLPRDPSVFDGLRVAVFGLGCRKTYPDRYQRFAKRLEEELVARGAVPVLPRGEGDDSGTLETDFEAWKADQFFPFMHAFAEDGATDGIKDGAPEAADPPGSHGAEPAQTVQLRGAKARRDVSSEAPCANNHPLIPHHLALDSNAVDATPSVVFAARVLRNTELYGEGSHRSCRHLVLEKPAWARYEAGDHLGILPTNPGALVAGALDALLRHDALRDAAALEATRWFTDRHSDGASNAAVLAAVAGSLEIVTPPELAAAEDDEHPLSGVVSGTTLRGALTSHYDLCGPATRDQLVTLAAHAADPKERDHLTALAESGPEAWAEHVRSNGWTVVDALLSHPSVAVPLYAFLDALPRLSPRFYSISSSPAAHRGQLHLTVGVEHNLREGPGVPFEGCCSGMLAHLHAASPQSIVPGFIRPSTFRLPADPTAPCLFIGGGTGVAPLRAFWHEVAETQPAGQRPVHVYFGCRHADEALYADELSAMRQRGVLASVDVGYSAPPAGGQQRFLDAVVRDNAATVWDALQHPNAAVYVCGTGQAGTAVKAALVDIVLDRHPACRDRADAEAWVEQLREQRRYQEDVFGA